MKDDMCKCIHEIPWKTAKFVESVGIRPFWVYIDSRKSWHEQHILSPSIPSDSLLPTERGGGTGTIDYVFLFTTGRVTSVRELWTSLRNSSSLPLSFCVDDRWSGQEFALASFLWGFYCYYLLVLHIHGCLSSMCCVLSVVSRLRKWELGGGKAAYSLIS